MPPRAPPAQPGQPASASLRAQFAALQARFDTLLAMVESMRLREVPLDADGSVGSKDGCLEAAVLEEARQVLGEEERKASAVAALLSAIESRQVESLQLALTVAEAAGLEGRDLVTAKCAVAAEQRKASAQVALVSVLQVLEVGTLEVAVRQGQLAGSEVAGLAAAMTALSRVEDLVVSAREASALALAVLATDRCRSCHGRGSTLVDVCLVCFDKPRRGQMDVLVKAETAASEAASARMMDLAVVATGASAPELEVVATEQCSNCLGSGSTVFGTCVKCHGSGRGASSVLTMAGGRPLQ
jgi:mono/diheme cytochrome c family protein